MASVNQAAYVPGTANYQFGYNSDLNIPITEAPADTDWQRWAMLYDGSTYRMYFFKAASNDIIYQFAWDGSSYKFAHDSAPELTLTQSPANAGTNSFSMLYGEDQYHLYLRPVGQPETLYQYLWVPNTTTYKFDSELQVIDFPSNTDWTRWSMLHDGSNYRLYAFELDSKTQFYQGAWNGAAYQYGHNSISTLTLKDAPADTNLSSMSMLYDGSSYRLYMQTL